MAVYPNVRAGQRITNELLTSNEEFFIRKATSTSRASTATPANDPELTAQLEANAIYYVEMHVHAGTPAVATTGGLQTMWTVPTSTTLRSCWGPDSTTLLDGSAGGTPRMGVHGAGTAVEYGAREGLTPGVADNTFQFIVKERGYVITTAAGTLAFEWAQVVSNATPSIVYSGSYMTVKRLA